MKATLLSVQLVFAYRCISVRFRIYKTTVLKGLSHKSRDMNPLSMVKRSTHKAEEYGGMAPVCIRFKINFWLSCSPQNPERAEHDPG